MLLCGSLWDATSAKGRVVAGWDCRCRSEGTRAKPKPAAFDETNPKGCATRPPTNKTARDGARRCDPPRGFESCLISSSMASYNPFVEEEIE